MNKFISKDGHLNVAEVVALAKEINRKMSREGQKIAEIWYSGRAIPKYDADKALDKETWNKKRAQVIKMRKKMPVAGSSVKMVTLLTTFKGIEDTEYAKDVALILKAIDAHNAKTAKVVEQLKELTTKRKVKAGAIFDKNIETISALLLKAGLKSSDMAIGDSMLGKTMIVKLPDGYISIGKADADRFEKAKNPPEVSTFGRAKVEDSTQAKPVRSSKVVATKKVVVKKR